MKLLRCIRSLDPASGGTVENLRRSSDALVAQGHKVVVATLDPPSAPWLKTFDYPIHALGHSEHGYGFSPDFIPWVKEHAPDFDAVIVCGLWQYHGYGTWQALRGSGIPYFVFPHGMLDPWFKRRYPLKHLKKWLYWPWAEYRVLRDAAAVLFTCEEERRLARESFWLYRANERVVRFGTSAPPGDPAAQRREFFRQFPALEGKRLLLFLGRLHPKKGCDLLLEAFAKVLEDREGTSDTPIHLVFAGPSSEEYLAELKDLAARWNITGQITWTGMLDGNAKWGAFHAANAFILPSHQENFGIAVAEAMACGKGVLISNKVNIWREIEESRAGLVADDNLEGTRFLLEGWLALSAEQQDAMGKRAQACFARHFEIQSAARHLAETITEVVGQGALVPRLAATGG